MSQHTSKGAGVSSGWWNALLFMATLLILFHFVAVGARILAAPSGPWFFSPEEGADFARPPQFAQGISAALTPTYLKAIKMDQDYHFVTNNPRLPDVRIETRVREQTDQAVKVVVWPDEKANFWVRHRQSLLAQALGGDMPYNLEGERAPPEGKDAPRVTIWKQEKDGSMKLDEEREHEIRDLMRSGPVIRPSDLSRILARSYSRFLSRLFPEASAEVIRRSRNSVSPTAFSMGGPPPQAFEDMVANFGGAKP
jgi:hypothetical protein